MPAPVSYKGAGDNREGPCRVLIDTGLLCFVYGDGMNKATKNALTIVLIIGFVIAIPVIASLAQLLMAAR
jgi:hypothetical protein